MRKLQWSKAVNKWYVPKHQTIPTLQVLFDPYNTIEPYSVYLSPHNYQEKFNFPDLKAAQIFAEQKTLERAKQGKLKLHLYSTYLGQGVTKLETWQCAVRITMFIKANEQYAINLIEVRHIKRFIKAMV